MKVKHSWLNTVMMRCDLVTTIKWRGNAFEHNDLSALSWFRAFFKTNKQTKKVAPDDTVLHN